MSIQEVILHDLYVNGFNTFKINIKIQQLFAIVTKKIILLLNVSDENFVMKLT